VQWRSPITMLVLLVLLVAGGWYGYTVVRSPTSSSPTTSATGSHCLQWKTYPKGAAITSTDLTVNVYNAGTVSGQADKVLTALHARGFVEGVAANSPAGIEADNVTIVTPTPRSPVVSLVKSQFNGTVQVSPGSALGSGVDVVIGDHYGGIDAKAPRTLTVAAATRVCIKRAVG
jgi:hypothetical protein